MAVPKRKTSKAKGASRKASAWRLDLPSASTCPSCGSAKRPHHICASCGYYKGRQAVEVE
ncbi:MAG: 50S ribosomal protein L32 [Acidimicrobiales bacterium]